MPSPVNLDDVAAGVGGFKIIGEAGHNRAGRSVAGAGDVNGDGFADLIVGAPGLPWPFGNTPSPGAYVVFGKAAGFAAVDLADVAAGVGGFKIASEADRDLAGRSVSGAGDINGDGFADLIVGAPFNEGEPDGRLVGAAYVLFGKADGFATIGLGAVAAGAGGFKLIGASWYDEAGSSVSGAGDVNGDGFADLIIGAPGEYSGFSNPAGAAYVVFGKAGGFTSFNLFDVHAGDGGFRIFAEAAYDHVGLSVSGAGDVNGDGFADLIVGALGNDAGNPDDTADYGAAYVVFGKAGGFAMVDLGVVAAGAGGFKIIGENPYDEAGSSVSGAGDVNGDGFDDLLIGASGNDIGGVDAGAAYVVFGKADDFTTVNLGEVAAGVGGFKIIGETAGDVVGSVSGAGDVNGDGLADLIVGTTGNDAGGADAGVAYVLFGKAGGIATVDLAAVAAGAGGFKIIGESEGDRAGVSVSAAGDVNRDGLDDLLVGAFLNDAGGEDAGAAYVVFGRASHAIAGTGGDDSLSGTAGDDLIRGLGGNDTVQAGAGHDRLEGGAGRDRLSGAGGNDVLAGGSGNDTLDGGAGDDTADYSGTGQDLAIRLATGTAAGEGADRLFSIETVLGGGGDDAIIGNSAANLLLGDAGADDLEGGRNNDTLRGGSGNDTLSGARDHDLLVGGTGIDLLRGDSGNDTLLGGDDADRLVGGAGGDRLEGGVGADALRGESGNDILIGDAADDDLYGGYGADTLTGGPGVDHFVLTALGESGTSAATRDVIADFRAWTGDVIDLSRIDAVQGSGGNDAFAFIGTGAFTAAGQVRFEQSESETDWSVLVEGNVDDDLAADFQITLLSPFRPFVLTADDFML